MLVRRAFVCLTHVLTLLSLALITPSYAGRAKGGAILPLPHDPTHRIYNGWGVGTFEYRESSPAKTDRYLFVWTETVGPDGKMSRFSGIVEPKTEIHVPNIEKFDRKNLSSLNGRLVAAQGRIRQEGQGEATVLYLEEVWILVLE